jgi:hypothetical protein
MLGQQRGNDVARMEQDGFLFVRRDLDEAKSSEQENSFNSQQCVTDFMHIATFRSKRIEQYAVIASHWLQHVRGTAGIGRIAGLLRPRWRLIARIVHKG